MTCRGDVRCQMDVEPDVITFADKGLASMQPHAHPYPSRSQSGLSLGCRGKSLGCGLENSEGRVAFRANLDAAVTNERFA